MRASHEKIVRLLFRAPRADHDTVRNHGLSMHKIYIHVSSMKISEAANRLHRVNENERNDPFSLYLHFIENRSRSNVR